MPGRPSLLDNLRPDAIHGDGLAYLADDLDERHDLSVATGYVNLGGLHHLATTVRPGRTARLLLGAAPSAGLGGEFPATLFERTLLALREERDIARFPASRALKRLLAIQEWLDRPNVDVRRYVAKFLHGKAYLFGDRADARAALVTSANLTAAGMWRNLELGLVHYDPEVSRRAIRWFDELWDQATPYKDDLRDFLFPDVDLLDPRAVYLRALLELFGDVLDEEGTPPEAVELAPFQEDGFRRALGIIGRHRGVVYADGVGAGKTFVGMAFVEEYAVRRGRHVLIVVPAQLKEKWRAELDRARLPAQVVSYHGFAADEQLADPRTRNARRVLSNTKDAYRLVIFDEAHSLRNPDTIWYRATSRLLGGREKDVVLLTATPINNGLWDLYHMVLAFARHDRAFATHGIGSLRRLFLKAGANERDPENLDPDVLFPLADMVSVRRDRRFIEARYPGATFPDGTPVRFPEPRLSTERYDLDEHYPGLVVEITARIQRLKMARYRPSRYRLDADEQARERTLATLLQSGVLKRFESCWHACLLTVRRMLSAHHVFLEAWDDGHVPVGDALVRGGPRPNSTNRRRPSGSANSSTKDSQSNRWATSFPSFATMSNTTAICCTKSGSGWRNSAAPGPQARASAQDPPQFAIRQDRRVQHLRGHRPIPRRPFAEGCRRPVARGDHRRRDEPRRTHEPPPALLPGIGLRDRRLQAAGRRSRSAAQQRRALGGPRPSAGGRGGELRHAVESPADGPEVRARHPPQESARGGSSDHDAPRTRRP